MGTSATIKFTDEYDEVYFVYRGHDANPDNVLSDLNKAIDKVKKRFSRSEIGQLMTVFFGETYQEKTRVQDYELTSSHCGGESYKYTVDFIDGSWIASVVEH